MNRREFLAASASLATGLRVPKPKAMHKHWIWTSVNAKAETADLRAKYKALKAHGLSGVYISGVDKREFEIIREAELEVHTWMWTTNRGDEWVRKDHPDWYMVSRSGKSCFDKPPYVDYYRWISPVIPGVQLYLKEKVAELAANPLVTGVHLDYVRYPDVILPNGLWKTYNLDQTEEMDDYDFCYSDHTRAAFKKASGRDPKDIKDPATDQEWLKFRYDSVTNLVKQLTEVAHGHKKQITAAVFPTPSMARKICRQDWDKWPLDAFCPMVYHSFYEEPVGWVGDAVREDIQAVTKPIYAGLYMPAFATSEELESGVKIALKRGASGISLFGDPSPEMWKAFERASRS